MKKILYIDADEISAILFKKSTLRMVPFKVAVTVSEKTAVAEIALTNDKFDLVISQLYSIDGIDLIRNLREGNYGDNNKNVPAIAISSIGLIGTEDKCLHVGFNACVTIPDIKHLLAKEINKIFAEK